MYHGKNQERIRLPKLRQRFSEVDREMSVLRGMEHLCRRNHQQGEQTKHPAGGYSGDKGEAGVDFSG